MRTTPWPALRPLVAGNGYAAGEQAARPAANRIKTRPTPSRSHSRVVVEGEFTGTHSGALGTPGQEVGGTGRTMSGQFLLVFTVDRGTISEIRTYSDYASVLMQLGMAPSRNNGAPPELCQRPELRISATARSMESVEPADQADSKTSGPSELRSCATVRSYAGCRDSSAGAPIAVR